MRARGLALCLSLGLALGACGEEDPLDSPAPDIEDPNNDPNNAPNNDPNNMVDESALTFFKDIKPLLDDKCNQCHVEGGVAPFPLETYEQVSPLREAIRASVQEGTMPPWQPGEDCTDYYNDLSMSEIEVGQIVNWIDEGALMGDPNSTPNNQAAPRLQLPRIDSTIGLPEPYAPVVQPDEYRCFLMDWDETETKYIVGYDVKPDNKSIVHHVIGYLITPDQVAEYDALDAGEEGPGYTCYGGPGGSLTNWIGAWAPGSNAKIMPEGTGIKVEPGSKVLLQMHYNSLSPDPSPDRSTMEFMLADQVEKDAFIFPFTDFLGWIRDNGMEIPAGEKSVTHSYEFDPTRYLDYVTGGTIPNGAFKIYSASLHMHTLGKSGRIAINRDQDDDCMLEIPDWDFNWQDSYGFMEPKLFEPGDKLFLECNWDNSAENQPFVETDTDGDDIPDSYEQVEPRDVKWGEGTFDEMCLGILYITAE